MYTQKTNDIYKDIAEDVETRFDTLNYELDKPLRKGKNKKVIELMKGELGRKIMAKSVGLRTKAYSYLKMTVVKIKNHKKNSAKKFIIKFENYKSCLEANQQENKINHLQAKRN